MTGLPSEIDLTLTFSWPAADLRMSRLPPGTKRVIAHDWSVDDGAHQKPPFEPRGYDLPETEKFLRSDFIEMEYRLAKLWFDMFVLCAPSDLKPLPENLCYDAQGNRWLPDYLYDHISPVEQWWLFYIYWARFATNKKSVDLPGYYDPITGYGVPDENGQMRPFMKEGVTCGGNLIWVADGVGGAGTPFWCIDALADPLPSAEKLLEYPYLVHAATVSTVNHHDPTAYPNAPKGRWDVDPFGYFSGNVVPFPQFSIWTGTNAATMVHEGIPLRVNWLADIRIQRLADETVAPCPYFPARPLFPK